MELSTHGLIPEEEVQPVHNDPKLSIFDVANASSVWEHLQGLVHKSMPEATLLSVRRVWNRQLWYPFCRQRQDVAQKRGDAGAGSRLLFHGASSCILSKIVGLTLAATGSSSSGFNTNMGGSGAYSAPGCGCYFAEHAIYPVEIHPTVRNNENGVYVLIVAEVICGDVVDYGTQRKPGLKEAPENPQGGVYDSVSGTEDSVGIKYVNLDGREEFGRQYIVYRNSMAYPHFVITLRRGYTLTNVHSGRRLYASPEGTWGEHVGAGSPSLCGADVDWISDPQGGGVVRFVNVMSDRCLYAAGQRNWNEGFGAGSPAKEVGKDGEWQLSPRRDGYWRIVNVSSGRCLYASRDKEWEDGRGAGRPEQQVGADGEWMLFPDPPPTLV